VGWGLLLAEDCLLPVFDEGLLSRKLPLNIKNSAAKDDPKQLFWTKSISPQSDRFGTAIYTALSQQSFYITVTEIESVSEPYSILDYF